MGRLKKAVYGCRGAPQAWLNELGGSLKEGGFISSRVNPGVYYHPVRDKMLVAHVDDLLVGGTIKDVGGPAVCWRGSTS